jgi:hypothetical protein
MLPEQELRSDEQRKADTEAADRQGRAKGEALDAARDHARRLIEGTGEPDALEQTLTKARRRGRLHGDRWAHSPGAADGEQRAAHRRND